MEFSTITSAYTGLKAAKDIFVSLAKLKSETDSIDKINDAVKKVSDAQDTLFQIKDELFQLQDENNKLKQEIDEFNSWKSKQEAYELVSTEGGAVVYKFKSEPEHFVCPSCFEKRKLEILQDNRTMSGKFRCIGCTGEFPIKPLQKMKPAKVRTISSELL